MSHKFVQDLKDDDTRLHFSDRSQSHLVAFVVGAVLTILIYSGIMLAVWYDTDHARPATADVPEPQPKPNLFIRLEGVEGLDTCISPPAFHLVVDADWIPVSYRYCSGGCNSMLRVSYHGMILAWGHVPCFCVEGSPTSDGINGVATVEAKADGVVLREEVRSLVQSELDVVGKAEFVVGKAEFDVEGEVKGLGYLLCKTLLFKGNVTEEASLCLVH